MSVLGDAPAKGSGHCLTTVQTQRLGERGENYFYGFFFPVREENKRLLT